MTIHYYSATTGGFYVQGVHASVPDDAVEISSEEHAALIAAQADGRRIQGDADGRPAAVLPGPPSIEQQALQQRAKRDALLAASDSRMLSDYPQTQTELQAWLQYREALRRVPEQPGFPETVTWPKAPN